MAGSPKKIAVLGGSSPFTAALLDALAVYDFRGRRGSTEFALCGRDANALASLADYGAWRLATVGAAVIATTQVERALDGADIVVSQIRFGGLQARAREEQLALELGCAADETLGPCGLASALRQRADLLSLAELLKIRCPKALILNLSNPLSLTTALLADSGLDVIGICELPITTLRESLRLADLNAERAKWHYCGFNHRGFLFDISSDGHDVLADVTASYAIVRPAFAETIRELSAIPLKYFQLFRGPTVPSSSRAQDLMLIRDAVAAELTRDSRSPPPSLARRNTEWYDCALAPILAALLDLEAVRLTINVSDGDLVRERQAYISHGQIELSPPAHREGRFNLWLDRFEKHERLSRAALGWPNRENIEAALANDMITPHSKISLAATRLLEVSR